MDEQGFIDLSTLSEEELQKIVDMMESLGISADLTQEGIAAAYRQAQELEEEALKWERAEQEQADEALKLFTPEELKELIQNTDANKQLDYADPTALNNERLQMLQNERAEKSRLARELQRTQRAGTSMANRPTRRSAAPGRSVTISQPAQGEKSEEFNRANVPKSGRVQRKSGILKKELRLKKVGQELTIRGASKKNPILERNNDGGFVKKKKEVSWNLETTTIGYSMGGDLNLLDEPMIIVKQNDPEEEGDDDDESDINPRFMQKLNKGTIDVSGAVKKLPDQDLEEQEQEEKQNIVSEPEKVPPTPKQQVVESNQNIIEPQIKPVNGTNSTTGGSTITSNTTNTSNAGAQNTTNNTSTGSKITTSTTNTSNSGSKIGGNTANTSNTGGSSNTSITANNNSKNSLGSKQPDNPPARGSKVGSIASRGVASLRQAFENKPK